MDLHGTVILGTLIGVGVALWGPTGLRWQLLRLSPAILAMSIAAFTLLRDAGWVLGGGRTANAMLIGFLMSAGYLVGALATGWARCILRRRR